MTSIALNQHRRMTLWAILGPLSMIVTLSIFWFLQPQHHYYFPLLAIAGLVLSWTWRWTGFFLAAAGLLMNSSVIYYQTLEVSNQVWLFGICSSLIVNCFITALCSYEVGDILIGASFTTQETEQKTAPIAEVFPTVQEHQALTGQLIQVREQKEELHKQLLYYQELLTMAKRELLTLNASFERVSQEAIQKRQEADLVREEFELLKEHVQLLAEEPQKDLLAEKEAVISKYGWELESVSRALAEWKDKAIHHEKARERSERDSAALEQELLCTQDRLKDVQCLLRRSEEESYSAQIGIQELRDYVETLKREKQLLEKTMAQLQMELEAAHNELSHNRQAIEAYVATIHSLRDLEQERQREIQYEKQTAESIKAAADKKEALLQKQLEEIGSKWMETIRQNTNLQEQLAELPGLRDKCIALQQHTESLEKEKTSLSDVIAGYHQEGAAHAETRKAMGLYQQLREQFEEKGQALDAARRDLFRAEEKIIALEKDKEEKLLGDSPDYKALVQHLAACEKDWTVKEREYQGEIDELNDLIKSLFEKNT